MQCSFFEPGRPVIFTCSTDEHVDATMKGPLEKGELFAVLKYMKVGQVFTRPCAPPSKNDVLHLVPSPSPEPCVMARRVSKPNICMHLMLYCL